MQTLHTIRFHRNFQFSCENFKFEGVSRKKSLNVDTLAFAAENRTSVAEMVTQYPLAFKRRSEGEQMRTILAHPLFEQSMEEAQAKLRDGTAQWHSYDEVFED